MQEHTLSDRMLDSEWHGNAQKKFSSLIHCVPSLAEDYRDLGQDEEQDEVRGSLAVRSKIIKVLRPSMAAEMPMTKWPVFSR